MKLELKVASTSVTVNIFIRDSSSTTGAGLTGLVFNSASLTAYYMLPRAAAVSITLATLAAVTSVYSSGGFKEIDATNAPGWYRFDIPDAALASGIFSSFHLKGAANMAPLPIEIALVAYDPQDSVRLGLTALPNAAAAVAGGLPTSGTGSNQIDLDSSGRVNIGKWLGTLVTAATGGIPDVNAKNLGNTSQTGRDIGASVLLSAGTGTGQLDFTSGVVKVNLVQILGTALTETAGQIAAAFKQFFNIASPTSTMNLVTAVTTTTTATNLTNAPTAGDFTATMKTSLNASTPASVTGSVGSVTGNVGGNVVGSVGSVTAAVSITAAAVQAIWDALTSALTTVGSIGKLLVTNIDATISSRSTFAGGAVASVTGNVGGNVVGSAGSVVARVTANTDQLAGQTVTAAAGVTFPSSVASPTNLTAGIITTVSGNVNGNVAGSVASVVGAVGSVTGNVGGSVGSVTAAVSITAGAVQAIWDALTSALTTVGSIGKLLVTNIDATISSRSTFAGGTVSAVTGNVGGNVVGSVGSVVADVGITQSAADKVWATASRTLTSFGTLVSDVATAVWGAAARTLSAFGFTVTTDVSATVTTNLNATVSSRLASASYTTPPTAVQNADGLLGRNLGAGSDGGHTVQDALRPLRNKVTTQLGTLTVFKEDGTTTAWTAPLVTSSTADPIVEVDPT